MASAAGVSAALVVKHYGSKDGLRDAVDEHVAAVFEAMLAEVVRSPRPDPAELRSLAETVADHLPPGSAVTDYLGRMLVDGGPAGAALFRRLYGVAVATLDAMVAAGQADPGADPAVRAAVLLTHDLGTLILRRRVADVLGLDPLSREGTARWGAEILTIYATGLARIGARAPSRRTEGPAMTTPVSPRVAAAGGRILRTRWLMRMPIWLYRARLGAIFGSRMLMVEHIGRTSGARRYVTLETFGHPDEATYLIVSGFGTKAQWFRNLMANPNARVWVGSRRPVPAIAERLDDAAADAALEDYTRRHAKAWAGCDRSSRTRSGGRSNAAADIPIVALHVRPVAASRARGARGTVSPTPVRTRPVAP